ncbi:M16 family metallopeptidase [Algoriphagus boritolerans]|uniref:Insulinase (Peptidase family M16) n=1 Tax=Algoriphagus boritolerans DSM 17298 = JCM 18970 TaxID=1120964 RepID=A0A1H5USR5_9BACT|nr:pitrilysin family protein [Algoriphagus boritolerans]SEF77481.1 Insulinase (Peptidase family M16) [Algoriphagus boritolerans DSM 17298 = JCM 18970]
MFPYQRIFLNNGLEVIVHEDHSSKIAVFNLLYKVGSRFEQLGKTGLAHFFEHLMFGSSANVPVFDRELERVGGSCNAFTSPDITNYYMTLPAANIETAFWLESDRMLQLSLSEKTIETQRKVVMEEYKQRYLNQPYGDVWHHLRDLAYEKHSYRWPTIGQTLQDIEEYTKDDVLEFYETHYHPGNAILVVAGDVTLAQVENLAEKWFGPIPSRSLYKNGILAEPIQTAKKSKELQAKVPTDALYKAYKMPAKGKEGYLEADLISDILGSGKSSLLEQRLIKNGKIFASVGGYITGSVDPGLLVFSGKMESGISAKTAEAALDEVLAEFLQNEISERELQKIKHQGEAMKIYESIQLLNRAMNLAYYAHLGDPDLYWQEFEQKSKIEAPQIKAWASQILKDDQASVLYYQSIN